MTRPLLLAYHGLLEVPRHLDPHNLMLAPEVFVSQVTGLRRRGYAFVTVAEFARRLAAGEGLEATCALSFDDGSVDNHTVLPGLLERLDLHATIFACPGLLGADHPFLHPEAAVRLVTAEELRELSSLPRVEIGSHTVSHTRLDDARPDDAEREMRRSKAMLEGLLGVEVESFAYPGCGYSPHCPAAAERAGYTSAVTCGNRGGLAPFELRRETVNPLDGRLLFALKARGAYFRARRSPPGRLARAVLRRRRHGEPLTERPQR